MGSPFDVPPVPGKNPRDELRSRSTLLPLSGTKGGETVFSWPQALLDLWESAKLPGDVLTGQAQAGPEEALEFAMNFLMPATVGTPFALPGAGTGGRLAAKTVAETAAERMGKMKGPPEDALQRQELVPMESEFTVRRGAQMEAEAKAGKETSAGAQDQALKELEFQVRSEGRPRPETLGRLEEAVRARFPSNPEHADRLMARVREKFGQAAGAGDEPEGSVIDAPRGMGKGQEAGEGGNVVQFPGRQKPAQEATPESDIAGALDYAQDFLAKAEGRAAKAKKQVAEMGKPSASPERLRETALKQRVEQAGITIGKPKATSGSGRLQSVDDVVAETLQLERKGERGGTGLGHMFTNPDTGQVRVSFLSQGDGGRELVQVPFENREAAFQFLAAGQGKDAAAWFSLQRLQALKAAQEIKLGKSAEDILGYE